MNPLTLIDALRRSDVYIKQIYKNGGCYRFYLFLKQIYPEARCYINNGENHVVTKIDESLYDINGLVDKKDEWFYNPITDEQIKKTRGWSFFRHNVLSIIECPFCEEPICV